MFAEKVGSRSLSKFLFKRTPQRPNFRVKQGVFFGFFIEKKWGKML